MVSTHNGKTLWLDVQPRVTGLDHALYSGELSCFRCFSLFTVSYTLICSGLSILTIVDIGYIRCREVDTLHSRKVNMRL